MKIRMYFKIISFILLQAFLVFDVCWAAPGASLALKSTLAPAVSVDTVKLRNAFEKVLFHDGELGVMDFGEDESKDLEAAPMASDLPGAGNNVPGPIGGTGGNIDMLSGVFPPPPQNISTHSAFSLWLRSLFAYPFTKKELEKELKSLGFALEGDEISRRQLLDLIVALEKDKIFQKLSLAGITTIEYVPAMVRRGRVADTAVSISKSGVLIITDQFLKQSLSIKTTLMKDALSHLVHETRRFVFTDGNGNDAMATAQELGLPVGTEEMMLKIYEISRAYNDSNRWPGFKRFTFYQPEQNISEIMRIRKTSDPLRPDTEALSIAKPVVPYLVNLNNESPVHFTQLITSVLGHEGAKKGHLLPLPITSIEEAMKYFNWNKLSAEAAKILIQNFVDRVWPDEIQTKGTPPFAEWLSALTIIKETLQRFGFDRDKAEPYGIIWKEFQANYGMKKDQGLRSIALFFWFQNEYRKLNTNIDINIAKLFSFLTLEEQRQVKQMIPQIQKEYLNYAMAKPNMFATILKRMSGVTALVLGIVLTNSLFAQAADGAAAAQSASLGGVLGGALIVIWLALSKWNSRRADVPAVAVRLCKTAIRRQNPAELMDFYRNAGINDKAVILTAVSLELNRQGKEIKSELFEPLFMDALRERPASISRRLMDVLRRDVTAKMSAHKITGYDQALQEPVKNALRGQLPTQLVAEQQKIVSELCLVTAGLAVSANLHDKGMFVRQIEQNKILSQYFDAQKAAVVYSRIINQMPLSSKITREAVENVIVSALQKEGIAGDVLNMAVTQTQLLVYQSLSDFLPGLPDVSESRIPKQISSVKLTLINDIALQFVFNDTFTAVKEELKGALSEAESDRITGLLTTAMIRELTTNSVDAAEESFYQMPEYAQLKAADHAVEQLHLAAASALFTMSESGIGSQRLVDFLKEYVEKERPYISNEILLQLISTLRNLEGESTQGQAGRITLPPVSDNSQGRGTVDGAGRSNQFNRKDAAEKLQGIGIPQCKVSNKLTKLVESSI